MEPTIAFIGKVSSGKSSVINSLLGGFYSNISLLRETSHIQKYHIKKMSFDKDSKNILRKKMRDVGSQLEEIHANSEKILKNLSKSSKNDIPDNEATDDEATDDESTDDENDLHEPSIIELSTTNDPIPSFILPTMTLIDYPGVDDSDDVKNTFYNQFQNTFNKWNVIIYVTDAYKAFMDKSEVELFNKIHKLISDHNSNGNFIDLLVLVNKFDEDETDLNKIYEKIHAKLNGKIEKKKIIKYSSYTIFYDMFVYNGIRVLYPEPHDVFKSECRKIFKSLALSLDDGVIGEKMLHSELVQLIIPNNAPKFKKNEDAVAYIYKTMMNEFTKNGLIAYLKIARSSLETGMKESRLAYIDRLIADIEKYYEKDSFTKLSISESPEIMGLLECLYDSYKPEYKSEIETRINNALDKLDKSDDNFGIAQVSLLFLEIAMKYNLCIEKIPLKLFKKTSYDRDFVCRDFVFLVCNHSNYINKFKIDILDILKQNIMPLYTTYLTNLEDNLESSIKFREPRVTNNKDSQFNWFITKVINTAEIHQSVKYLLKLSCLTSDQIKYMDSLQLLRYDIFDDDFPYVKRNIKYLCLKKEYILICNVFIKNNDEIYDWNAIQKIIQCLNKT